MNFIESVVLGVREIEGLLKDRYGATGKSLHEKVTSVSKFDAAMVKKLRYVSSVRNKLIHERNFTVENEKGYLATIADVINRLERGGRHVDCGAVSILSKEPGPFPLGLLNEPQTRFKYHIHPGQATQFYHHVTQVRINTDNGNSVQYKLTPGMAYEVEWNFDAERWDIFEIGATSYW